MDILLLPKIVLLISTATLCFGRLTFLLSPSDPPPHKEVALMARYIMHNCNWVSIATISTQDGIKGYPFVSLKSLSDGPKDNSTGIPFLYMTKMDVSGQDVEVNNKVTIMASLAELEYCEREDFDPQDPRCAKVIITGRLKKVNESTSEYQFGKEALFARHPAMKDWPLNHNFYVAQVEIEQICVLDFFGGIKHVTQEDYFSANVTDFINLDSHFQRVSVVAIKGNM